MRRVALVALAVMTVVTVMTVVIVSRHAASPDRPSPVSAHRVLRHPPATRPTVPPAVAGCTLTVDDTDPLAVAAAVARWLYCGNGPPGVLTAHGQQVVARWVALAAPPAPAIVVGTELLDPRSSPVVVLVVVVRPPDPSHHEVVLTLFPRLPSGDWEVDDLQVEGTPQPIDSAISWQVWHTGYLRGSRPGTHTLPHSARTAVPFTIPSTTLGPAEMNSPSSLLTPSRTMCAMRSWSPSSIGSVRAGEVVLVSVTTPG